MQQQHQGDALLFGRQVVTALALDKGNAGWSACYWLIRANVETIISMNTGSKLNKPLANVDVETIISMNTSIEVEQAATSR